MLIHLFAISFCAEYEQLVVLQSKSDKRERSITTGCFEVPGNEGEGEEGIGVHLDPWATWVEVIIC